MTTYGYEMPGGQTATPSGDDPTTVLGRRTAAWIVDAVLFGALMFVFSMIGPFAKYEAVPEDGPVSTDEACDVIRDEIKRQDDHDVQCVILEGDGPLSPYDEDRAYYVRNEVQLLGGLAALGWFVLIYVVMQGMTGLTPGKALFRVKVVDQDGRPPGMGRSLLRSLLWIVDGFPFVIPALGFILGLTSTGHRRVGDMAAHTLVVRTSQPVGPIEVPGLERSEPPWSAGSPPPGGGLSSAAQPGRPLAPPTAPPATPPSVGPPARPTSPPTMAPTGSPTGPPAMAPSGPPAASPSTPSPPTGPIPPVPPMVGPAPEFASPTAEVDQAPPSFPPAQASDRTEPAASPTELTAGSETSPSALPAEAADERTASSAPIPSEPPPGEASPTPSADVSQSAPEPEPEPATTPGPDAMGASQPDVGPAASDQTPAAAAQPTYEPQWDEARGAYIQWDPGRNSWLQWDDSAKEWNPI